MALDIATLDPADARGEVDIIRGIRIVKEGHHKHPFRVERKIAATLDEAQKNAWDWWDPDRQSWVRAGNKYEKEYPENAGRPYVQYEEDAPKKEKN